MLLWFVTLCASLKPLSSMLARLLYAGAFLYLAQHDNHTELDLATSEKYATTTTTTTSSSPTLQTSTTEFWPFEEDSSADRDWEDQDFFSEGPAKTPPAVMDRSDSDSPRPRPSC